ncbi:hypothetical protein CAPTEDRAFT_203904 [Capitella teleta]|uniref:Uncharacterized protein n=1 Tax=Capitella teleta TaxID=283909 RepID=R7UKC9_CAPTE|nr:hypothetical protein CAPTEDRAFT_203904 [Capitella teleta]|eukprot:ELU06994.1 hypothetical protein CAPTEDRAFT_203904 [Capitella teleta]
MVALFLVVLWRLKFSVVLSKLFVIFCPVCIGKERTGIRGGLYGCLVDGERDGSVVTLIKGWVMYKVFDIVGRVGQQRVKDVGGFIVSDRSWLVDELGEEVVCKAGDEMVPLPRFVSRRFGLAGQSFCRILT